MKISTYVLIVLAAGLVGGIITGLMRGFGGFLTAYLALFFFLLLVTLDYTKPENEIAREQRRNMKHWRSRYKS